ncbi:DMT family transporter [Paenibacillus mendelii]|uniref:DMT family transporter n=1 Tax=Paenibacillus mendelii TaxID=206163 RepID=A0ABV6JF72_9BACL|nr:DMT family transporter [Paenibacillus mendelii]MCQ6557440.1 DMT family transporter [Paenibacillus mendelii]
MSKLQLWIGALYCFIAAVAWGAVFPIAERALHHMDPFWMTTFRYGTVALLLGGILYYKEGRSAFKLERGGRKLVAFGTCGFTINSMGLFWGQKQLGPSGVLLTSIMEAFMPLLVVLLVWSTTRQRPQAGTLSCIGLAFIGVLFVITKGDLSMLGSSELRILPLLSILIGVAGWVVYTVGSGYFQGWSALRYSTMTCILGSLVSLILNSVMTWSGVLTFPTAAQIVPTLPYLAFLIVIGGVVALLAWFKGIELLTSVNGILFINFVPVTTFLIAASAGHHVRFEEWLGMVLIIAAVAANNVISRRSSLQPNISTSV